MNKKIICSIFLIFPFLLFSQNISQEQYWFNGALRKKTFLQGQDTVRIDFFYENGNKSATCWRNDSAYFFDRTGVLRQQYYLKKDSVFAFQRLLADSTVIRNRFSKIQSIAVTQVGETLTQYFQNDTLWYFIKNYKYDAANTGWQVFLPNGNNWASSLMLRKQSLFQRVDTLYTPNNQIKCIKIVENFKDNDPIKLDFYDDKGTLKDEVSTSYSLKLDKDNTECLYGFRDASGNWAIPPQYENLKKIGFNTYIAGKPEKYTLLDRHGKPIFENTWHFLEDIRNFDISFENKEFNAFYSLNQEHIDLINSQIEREKNSRFKCRKDNKYGVIDRNGVLLLQPNYDNVRTCKGDFYEVQINKKWGIVDKNGTIIINPIYYKVYFTQSPHYFIVVDTLMQPYETEYQGLVNNKNQQILPIIFNRIEHLDSNILVGRSWGKNSFFNINTHQLLDSTKYVNIQDLNIKSTYEITVLDSKKEKKLKGILTWAGDTILKIEYLNFWHLNINDLYDENFSSYKSYIVVETAQKKFGLFNLSDKKWAVLPECENWSFWSGKFESYMDIPEIYYPNGEHPNLRFLFKKK